MLKIDTIGESSSDNTLQVLIDHMAVPHNAKAFVA